MNPEILASLEALLFASDAPLTLERVAEVLEVSLDEARQAMLELRAACDVPGRGVGVVEVAGGVRLVTRPELAPILLRLQRLRLKSRMSRAAVETLVIIAYRQPISRGEVEQLRGVGAESVLTHLLERRLIRVVGRKAAPGRPLLYGTTREFLEHFGLRDLGELPPFDAPARPSNNVVVDQELAETTETPEMPETEDAADPADGAVADPESHDPEHAPGIEQPDGVPRDPEPDAVPESVRPSAGASPRG